MIDLKIEPLKDVSNPNSVHGIYPYRGKISAVDATMIIKQFPADAVLLDPFCGTGTIVYEGLKRHLVTYGLDLNPLAYTVANGKINIPTDLTSTLHNVEQLITEAKQLLTTNEMCTESSKHFHPLTAAEIMKVTLFVEQMNDYVKACFFGAICLAARGCNGYKWTSTTVGKDIIPKTYINFYKKFLQKVKKHFFPIRYQEGKIYFEDARNLTKVFTPNTFDFVFTSPPYFDCLDYTSYYTRIVYNIMGYNRSQIREKLIQNFKTYENDMQQVLNQLYEVCKPGAKIIFVVGDKKVHQQLINGAEFFSRISPFKTVTVIERSYEKTSSKVFDAINKTERKEQIIVWEK